MGDRVSDAIDALSARELERMRGLIDKRLAVCILDGQDGAVPVRCTVKAPNKSTFTLLLCPACIQKHRMPSSRSG